MTHLDNEFEDFVQLLKSEVGVEPWDDRGVNELIYLWFMHGRFAYRDLTDTDFAEFIQMLSSDTRLSIEDITASYLPAAADASGVLASDSAIKNFLTDSDRTSFLRRGTYKLDSRIAVNRQGSVVLTTEPGTFLVKNHESNAFLIEPPAEFAGICAPADTYATSLTFPGASWTANAHAGKWVNVKVPSASSWQSASTYSVGDAVSHLGYVWKSITDNNVGNVPEVTKWNHWGRVSAVSRRVISNTSDTLTLEHPFGAPVLAADCDFYTPLDTVHLEGFTLLEGTGSANIVIRYARKVIVRNISLLGPANGNGLSVYHSDKVTISDVTSHSLQIPIFVYNCDDATVERSEVVSGQIHGVQLKDCRNSRIRDCYGHDGQLRAFDIKGSGLNPAYNMGIHDCVAERITPGVAFEAYVLKAEGVLPGYNFQITGGNQARNCDAGVRLGDEQATGIFRNVQVSDFQIIDCTGVGLICSVPGAQIARGLIEGSTIYGVLLSRANGCVLEDMVLSNFNSNGAPDGMVRVEDTEKAIIARSIFKVNNPASGTRQVVREMGSSTGNRYVENSILLHSDTALTNDYALLGTSKALRHPDLHPVPSSATMNSFAVDTAPRTVRSTSAISYTSTTTLTTHPELQLSVARQSRYKFKLSAVVTGVTGLRLSILTPGATIWYGTLEQVVNAVNGTIHVVTLSDTVRQLVTIEGEVKLNNIAGLLQARFAQTTSSETPTVVHEGSLLTVEKIAL